MATTKITSPELFDLGSLNTALKLPSGTTAERPTSPSTGEWRYNTTTNLVEFYDGGDWRVLQSEDIPPIPSENFSAVLYTGTGSAQSITGVGFKPDMVWIKDRIQAYSHNITDTSRGTSKQVFPNNTNAQDTTYTNRVTSFDADGFTIGNDNYVNTNGNTFVAWCWKANGGTTSSNTDGAVTTTVQVNTKAGFSIVEFSGTGSETTFGHGLGEKPSIVIIKRLDSTSDWPVYHDLLDGSMDLIYLNSNGTNFNSSRPLFTSSVFYFVTSGDYIAYCFAEKTGYSKFGSYTGNGAAGNEQNTGFEPAFVLIKRANSAGAWSLYDNKRSPSNPRDKKLVPNSDAAENNAGTTYQLNFLTNGFNFLGGGSDLNANGGTYIYIAFAADPSAAPVLADSFANKTYSGNSSTQSITGLGFSPNFSWIKVRNNTYVHGLYDTLRGPLQRLRSNGTEANENVPNSLTSFDSDGFTLGSDIGQNQSGMNYVAWNWKANPIPTINTDGTIQSIVSANQASGFSIVQYTAAAAGSSGTIGHGLSQAPEMIITKRTDAISAWRVGLEALGNWDRYLGLSQTNAYSTSSTIYSAAPTSSVYSIGNDPSMINDTIAYCFHSVSGFSKFGSYSGSGASGNAQNVGFAPGLVILKSTNAVTSWAMFDTARGANVLYSNLSNAESSDNRVTLTSTGFEFTGAAYNESGRDWVYMAFKENPAQPAIPSGYMAYLVVAGGGSGHRSDNNNGAGGGGAGGLRSSYVRTGGGGTVESNITLTAKTYTITIGAGGADNTTGGGPAISGNDSVLDTITSIGGGGGGGVGLPAEASTSGGSGGGGGGYNSGAGAAGTANQGFAGGNGSPSTSGTFSERNGGGGGGAGSVGTTGSTSSAGAGGSGVIVPITGTNVGYAGGGSGANKAGSGIPSTSGGGTGAGTNGIGTSGAANTGGGGGGGGVASYAGKGGGSGVVILRMNTSDYSGATTGSPTVTTNGSETILTYTGSGTYVHS